MNFPNSAEDDPSSREAKRMLDLMKGQMDPIDTKKYLEASLSLYSQQADVTKQYTDLLGQTGFGADADRYARELLGGTQFGAGDFSTVDPIDFDTERQVMLASSMPPLAKEGREPLIERYLTEEPGKHIRLQMEAQRARQDEEFEYHRRTAEASEATVVKLQIALDAEKVKTELAQKGEAKAQSQARMNLYFAAGSFVVAALALLYALYS